MRREGTFSATPDPGLGYGVYIQGPAEAGRGLWSSPAALRSRGGRPDQASIFNYALCPAGRPRRVLLDACGKATRARCWRRRRPVVGIDIDATTVSHARAKYGHHRESSSFSALVTLRWQINRLTSWCRSRRSSTTTDRSKMVRESGVS